VDLVFTKLNGAGAAKEAGLSARSSDLRVVSLYQEESTPLGAASFGGPEAYEFCLQTLSSPTATGKERLIKLIVPLKKGYIVRSDVIPLRLQDCLLVEQVKSFSRPLQNYGIDTTLSVTLDNDERSLAAIFAVSAAGILMLPLPQSELETLSLELDEELNNRLSFPWIIPEPARQRTLVLVEATLSSHPGDGTGLFAAVAALGIRLVVLDNAGEHWAESPDNAQICEAFVPTRLTNPPESDMKDNIVASLRAYGKPVDGIVTFADTYWPHVAEAAKVVGIQTASPEGFRIATNKYLTSIFDGHQAYRASTLAQAISVAQEHELPYPLIVKPCGGWSSEGVYRVDSRNTYEDAVSAILASRHGSELVIEPYCDGPEVDVNLVLQDGELLFFEVCDDLPKSADVNGPSVGSLNNFHELASIYPSKLPENEIELLRDAFLGILLSLDLRSGVFHLEGRVEHSAVEYTTQDGAMELSPRTNKSNHKPKAWLIEINPRPLGMTGSQIIESTYGIDYWGLALLSALGDNTRVRALTRPFIKGPQYTSIMVFIPADFSPACQGIFDSDDICADLISRRPELKANMSRFGCLVKRGQKIPHPSTGQNSFLAYFNVFSRNSREEASNIAKQVREGVRYTFI
jgi:glutathione synthase/RimK-type ligase-like ATP-grasp enzyme